MFPRSLIARTLVTLWLAACLAVLVDHFVDRNLPEADLFVIRVHFLTFPGGYALAGSIGIIFKLLYDNFGIVVPGGFIPSLIMWPFFVAVGYVQWFVLIPWIYRKLRKSLGPKRT